MQQRAVKRSGWMLLLSLLAAGPAPLALAEQQAAGPVIDMAPVQVSGEQPGPGLWKVTSPQGNVLWLLGTVSPLPAGVEWRSDQVEAIIAGADHVLGPPGWKLDADIGFFRGLTLLPQARRTARDPQGRTLEQVLPPPVYARWLQLKQANMGRDSGVEKERPFVASGRLYMAFLKRNGLRDAGQVNKALERAYKARGLERQEARVLLPAGNIRDALKEMQTTEVNDRACFERTLDTVEFQAGVLRERADAWSVGDVAALRRMAGWGMAQSCTDALADTEFARRRGWTDLPERARTHWLHLAEQSLRSHASTFAAVPASYLLGPQDYLGALAARGYTVEPPT